MREGGTIQVFLDDKEVGFKKYLVITFKDQGHGIISENSDDVFVPYFSTKENGRGLGLSISQRIIFEHEGRIYYVSKKDYGTSFFIELPLCE
jgi:C4-dicarboxylate-specific signal transduction histidine kinase